MPQSNDLSRSLTALHQDSTLIAAIEMSQKSWLVGAMVPGVERQPLKKLVPDAEALLRLLQRWREEAVAAGGRIARLVVAYEAGRDGFWLARWLQARGIEAYVIHPSSVPVSREHRRAKTDRLDLGLLLRALLGWLRGERGHCSMAAIPSLQAEDARRPSRQREALVGERTRIVNRIKSTLARFGVRDVALHRKAVERLRGLRTPEGVGLPPNTLAELDRDLARLQLVKEQIGTIERTRLERLQQPADTDTARAMLATLARVYGLGVETADVLVHEVMLRNLRDRRAVARYGGLTGAPDESGARRRDKGLSRTGNARVRRIMLQLAWRFLLFQKQSALVQWFQARTADGRPQTRKTMILALARKLLIALWRLATTGEVPQGLILRPAA